MFASFIEGFKKLYITRIKGFDVKNISVTTLLFEGTKEVGRLFVSRSTHHIFCVYSHHYFIIIIGQPLCPVVGRRPQHAAPKLPCLVLSSAISCCSIICPGRLSTACREVHRSYLRHLLWPAQDHFIFLMGACIASRHKEVYIPSVMKNPSAVCD